MIYDTLKYKKLVIFRFVMILIVFGLAIALAYITFHKPEQLVVLTQAQDQTITKPVTSVAGTENWKTMTNKKYGFSYKYPANTNKADDYGYLMFIVDVVDDPTTPVSLAKYAESIWTKNSNPNTNPNIKIEITPLKKTTIDGRDAYTFTLGGGFEYENASYMLDEPHVYIFTQNKNGTTFIIHYPVSDLNGSKIVETFNIDEKLIPAKVAPADWKIVTHTKGHFTYQYPSNILKLPESLEGSDWYVTGNRGSFSVRVLNETFDPEHIEGMYGPIEKTERVAVGGGIGYAYGWGDAGCFSRIIDMGLSQTQTLRITFGSCSDDLYYIANDKALQQEILSRFNLTP
jgi:hypothetical protein